MKLILLILGTLLYKGTLAPSAEKWVIQKNSSLSIEGRSNVNSFRCDITEYLQPDTIYMFKEDQPLKPFAIKGGLSIDIKRFDCHHKYITNDLRKTLKADEQPVLRIKLLNIGYYNGNAENIKGWVCIELAGVAKRAEIDYQVQSPNAGVLQLNGSRKLKFSDFGLKPRQKMAGLIKVEEELTVRFQLILHSAKQENTITLHKKK